MQHASTRCEEMSMVQQMAENPATTASAPSHLVNMVKEVTIPILPEEGSVCLVGRALSAVLGTEG